MAISYTNFKLLLDLNNRGFFNNKKSVIDMGDQDLNVNYEKLKESFKCWNINFNEFDFENSKKYPSRPRVPSSAFWKALGSFRSGVMSLKTTPGLGKSSISRM